ncbi:phosphotransferase [Microbacterium hominis]|uniref:Phosphotransferase n=1 Tax=Microbacterium hominis TaxID=162426 RepID=A0A7D4TPA7_9MICO|nr:phosphotransferase [Microbacterium hominis]QKJ18044.1 phosphotransferase [Microbacterium hominis]
MTDRELPLEGGNAAAEVVRVGDTVRKPWTSASRQVADFVDVLAGRGVDVPRTLGRDGSGRQIIEFVPGRLAEELLPLRDSDLRRVGHLIRTIHDAAEGGGSPSDRWDVLIPARDADLICHNDLAPWNLIVGDRWVFIDWDGAGPSTRLWDLAYAAQAFTLNDVTESPTIAADRLAALVDGYGADRALREALPRTMAERTEAMHDLLRSAHLTGRQPWATMYLDGHGAHWRAATEYVAQYERVWESALRIA